MNVGDCFIETVGKNFYLCMIIGKSYRTYNVEKISVEICRCGLVKKRVVYTESLINELDYKLIERTIYEKVEHLINKQNNELREIKKKYYMDASKIVEEVLK